jgi:hypothetical protein
MGLRFLSMLLWESLVSLSLITQGGNIFSGACKISGGLLGALFNALNRWMSVRRRR